MPPHRAAACAVASLLLALPARADGALSLRAALVQAYAGNPELQASAYELKTADGRALQAGLRPNPELGITVEDFAGSGELRGFRGAEFTLSLSQLVELGDKRGRRLALASAERGRAEAARAVQGLDLLGEVARRFIDVAADQERIALADAAVTLAEDTLKAVDARVQAARSPVAEGARARIALARARLDAAQAQARLASDRQNLAALWGADTPGFERVTADLYALPEVAAFASFEARLAGNPELAAFLSEARLRDAELRLAQSKRTQDFTIGGGIRRLQLSTEVAAVAAFSMPLGLSDRNQGAVAEAAARREQVDAEARAARLRIHTELYGLYQSFLQARARAAALAQDIAPQSQDALAQTEYAWRRGRYSYLEWADAQREWLAIRSERLEAAADCHRLLAELERLAGEPLAEFTSQPPATDFKP